MSFKRGGKHTRVGEYVRLAKISGVDNTEKGKKVNMTERLKFRLRIGDKIVGYEKWWGGTEFADGLGGCWMYSKDNKGWTPNAIIHTDKDQFTGLCEIKSRKEIYENDICENQYGWIGTIIWDSDIPLGWTVPFTGWWWKCKEEKDGKFPFDVDKKTKVISPELLEEKP